MTIAILISTQLGDIHAELYPDKAPITVANFLRYVDAGYYTGGKFWRICVLDPDNQPNNEIKIEVIQATVRADKEQQKFDPIALERTTVTGLRHLDGAISMARFAPDSAQGDFFICINDQPSLDFGGMRNPDGQGFAAFGRVTSGMDVVKGINKYPLEAQTLTPPVVIQQISRLDHHQTPSN
ncbi:MAG: peptidylprolyl isomerase [Caldilineaceae bacterium]